VILWPPAEPRSGGGEGAPASRLVFWIPFPALRAAGDDTPRNDRALIG
jgi:hypothetical protein